MASPKCRTPPALYPEVEEGGKGDEAREKKVCGERRRRRRRREGLAVVFRSVTVVGVSDLRCLRSLELNYLGPERAEEASGVHQWSCGCPCWSVRSAQSPLGS